MSERTQQETVELLREVKSVLSSINRSRHHQVEIEGDDPAYWQREEWVNWAVGEVLPRVEAALDAHIGEANEKAQPQPGAVAELLREAGEWISRFSFGGADSIELEARITSSLAGRLPEPSRAACQLPPSQDHMAELLREALKKLQFGDGYYRNFDLARRLEKALQGAPADHIADASNMVPKCGCHTCQPVTLENMRFVACPECGNKRCPKANDHRNACTGSNEPGQPGSAYQAPKGWRLVPEYPTDSMLAHGQDLALIQRHDGSAGYLANLEQVWAVMVCAAPKPSQEEQA